MPSSQPQNHALHHAANPQPLHPAPMPGPLWWQPCSRETLISTTRTTAAALTNVVNEKVCAATTHAWKFSSVRAPAFDSKPVGLSVKLCARMPHNLGPRHSVEMFARMPHTPSSPKLLYRPSVQANPLNRWQKNDAPGGPAMPFPIASFSMPGILHPSLLPPATNPAVTTEPHHHAFLTKPSKILEPHPSAYLVARFFELR